MLGSEGLCVGAQLGVKGIWEGETCLRAQGAMKGTGTVHGGEGCAWAEPPGDPTDHLWLLCPAPLGPLSQCPQGTAAAEPQPSWNRGKGAMAEQVSLQ